MLKIKRLYTFILQTFLPLFIMTFFICLFIVLMQFLWKYIDELVGKGFDIAVVGELFFYAAVTFMPTALPLSILLASLMVFGNLGEHFELTAMKSSGVSLLKVMSPLIVFISFVAVGAFFFQNDVLPKAQVKMWTLLFSMRQKSPELEIPEGAFYDQIQGYNIFVKQKDRNTGALHNMMIYDVSKGFGYASVIVADSGRLSFTEDKKYLYLRLYSGESFEDLKDNRPQARAEGMLYRRESFKDKEIMIPFDANFTRLDDQTMRDQYIGKNLTQLRHTIDSVGQRIDSVGNEISLSLRTENMCGTPELRVEGNRYSIPQNEFSPQSLAADTNVKMQKVKPVKLEKVINVDSLISASPADVQRIVMNNAATNANRIRQDYSFRGFSMDDDLYVIRRHQIEMMKKFTLSLACLIFFFIGAPLGAIIRKGGLGTPIVISVLLFIVYYIIDNFGYKSARDGRWEVWEGMWLSSAVLLPLGVYLTYKAVNDSAVFNPDAYRNLFHRITGVQQVRNIQMKELVMDDIVPQEAIANIESLKAELETYLSNHKKRQQFVAYWLKGYDIKELDDTKASIERLVDYLCNSKSQLIINKTMDFPVLRQLLLYCPSRGRKKAGMAMAAVFPISIPVYFIGVKLQKGLKDDIATSIKVCNELIALYQDLIEKAAREQQKNNN